MGAPGLGGRGRGVCGTWGREGGLPPWRRQKVKTSGNTAHTIIIFSPAQLIFFAASSAQGESMSGQSYGLLLLEEWR